MKQITVTMTQNGMHGNRVVSVSVSLCTKYFHHRQIFSALHTSDAPIFHVPNYTMHTLQYSIFILFLFRCSSKIHRLLDECACVCARKVKVRGSERDRDTQRVKFNVTHVSHTTCNFRFRNCWLTRTKCIVTCFVLAICSCYYITPKTIDWLWLGG